VARAIEILKKELDVTMALCGVSKVSDINRDVLAGDETQRRPQ
jgi:isopentenyl diphosphate isomerase/L-lactate dehydrogenase-like FMN-dependent dehydrogenase